jgi:hypothetical protein
VGRQSFHALENARKLSEEGQFSSGEISTSRQAWAEESTYDDLGAYSTVSYPHTRAK